MRTLSRSAVALLIATFFLSGLASLIYQISWQRLLTVYFGVGAVSSTLVISVYMFGLGLGSWIGGRLADRCSDPYKAFAWVEVLLGGAGWMSFPLILGLGRLTASGSTITAFLCMFALLSVPALLMGMTLPLLMTILVRSHADFLFSVSRLYFANTLGAAAGAVLTAYLLIPLVGLDGSIYLAAAANFILAASVFQIRQMAGYEREAAGSCAIDSSDTGPSLGRVAYLLVFVTGFLGIGYEVIWLRVIGILVKDSPYAFASIISVYLFGLSLGGLVIYKYIARRHRAVHRTLFFALQFLIALTVLSTFIGYYYLSGIEPFQGWIRTSFNTDVHPSLDLLAQGSGFPTLGQICLFLDVFLWPLFFLLVPCLLMGASFPLISSLALSRRGAEGSVLGSTCFCGVLGNILGGLVTGLVLLPWLGTERILMLFICAGLIFGFGLRPLDIRRRASRIHLAVIVLLMIIHLAVFPRAGSLYTSMHTLPFPTKSLYLEEGLDAVVLTYQNNGQFRNFINGQGHGYRPGPLFYAEAIEAMSFCAAPQKVLVIGFGAGSGTEAVLIPAEVKQVHVVELCGSLIKNLKKLPEYSTLLEDRRIQWTIGDGRQFLARNAEQYDLILMDPLRTTTAYSNNLHSRQFFALVARRLAPQGILMVGGIGDSLIVPRTLLTEFSYLRTYPHFSLASQVPFHRDHDRFKHLISAIPAEIQESLLACLEPVLDGKGIVQVTANYPVNQDWRPFSEYYLGLLLWR